MTGHSYSLGRCKSSVIGRELLAAPAWSRVGPKFRSVIERDDPHSRRFRPLRVVRDKSVPPSARPANPPTYPPPALPRSRCLNLTFDGLAAEQRIELYRRSGGACVRCTS